MKYHSIFSECLFAQREPQAEGTAVERQTPSIFSAQGRAQLQSMNQNLDAHFGAHESEMATSEFVAEYTEQMPEPTTDDLQGEDLKAETNRKTKPCGFDFPDGGWECSKCQNYNFKGRKECHRCKKPKTVKDSTGRPEHMFKPEQEKIALKAAKSKQKRLKKAIKLKEAKVLLEQQAALAAENPELKELSLEELTAQLKKLPQERAGDWVCQRCGNLNFSFRHSCNKCHLTL